MKSNMQPWQLALTVLVAAFIGVKLGMRKSSDHQPAPAGQASPTNVPIPPPPAQIPPSPVQNTPSNPIEALATVASQMLKQADVQTMRMTQISAEEETEIGAKYHRLKLQISRPANNDPRADFVQRIIDRLDRQRTTPAAKLKLTLLDSTDLNAYAGPDGYIYITTAFLDRFPGEPVVAMALAHEIGHIDLLHVRRKIQIAHQGAKILGSVSGNVMQKVYNQVSTPYQREEEFQADTFGLNMARRAGWQKQELLNLLREMAKIEALRRGTGTHRTRSPIELGLDSILATHPNTAERLARLEAQ